MIHYTLLPESEIRVLRREYRVRLFVILLFFLSIAIVIGIISLIPSFTVSRTEESKIIEQVEKMKKDRIAKGVSKIDKELTQIQSIVSRVLVKKDYIPFSEAVEKIGKYKTNGLFIKSFELSYEDSSATTTKAYIQGSSLTREALIQFKKNIESDSGFKNIELPISDLAKNKNITFSMRFNIIK
jgi:hypothetical protein